MKNEKKTLIAFCDSYKCKGSHTTTKKVQKTNLVGSPVDCPDCGSVLIWQTGPKSRNRIVKMGKVANREKL